MINKGSKISESYKGATAEGTNVDLLGSLILSADKTLSFKGSIYSKNKTDIGRFEYNNPEGAIVDPSIPYMGNFQQTVTITDKEHAKFQDEATNLMLNAIAEFAKPSITE